MRSATGVVGVVFVILGLSAFLLQMAWPEAVERGYGAVRAAIVSVENSTSGELPSVRLSSDGGIEGLDRCDGSFSEMTSYRQTGVPPVYAAHNNCGGDITHPWAVGQRVRIEGRGEVYEVVEVRDTPKRWVTTAALEGLSGDLALQTCYYGVNRMKFVGLVAVS
ncbi:hypothetical protein [uncultured Microbacterium sp.]|uniref:hypothetical protein n=1 Tax=uncultured Microbacterium sp. TaxID=191216 RepID=UPI0028E851F0|nr:hypothetical protein [uncultured Microbacterium sp.]